MRQVASFAFVVLVVWLGWQILSQVAVMRSPAQMVIRINPASPLVLGRAAEAELGARRFQNASALAAESLKRAPFNVRALRVLGLATAEEGRPAAANEMLTLAGNWSLRDDPSHAWLVQYRLSRGDFGSSFAHADTLARRREDLHPQLFQFFTVAASADPRAMASLADVVGASPPWRYAYLYQLNQSPTGLETASNLALALERNRTPMTDLELGYLYEKLLGAGRLPALFELRRRLNRPQAALLTNGDFASATGPKPFEWRLFDGAGLSAQVMPDDSGESALRVEYGGYSYRPLAEQLIRLPPGTYRWAGRAHSEGGSPSEGLSWAISCFETGEKIAESASGELPEAWRRFSVQLTVPAQRCSAQWLRLLPEFRDRSQPAVVWYDGFSISPSS
ncbi:hypothetical protein BrevBR_05145 [Brevundimonas sp. BR2-1]|uniref:hypothetical protein n=1 Tax=Brevundimonas sp. BR2-1 TaxID=3031123 RepID=UPI0030AC1853